MYQNILIPILWLGYICICMLYNSYTYIYQNFLLYIYVSKHSNPWLGLGEYTYMYQNIIYICINTFQYLVGFRRIYECIKTLYIYRYQNIPIFGWV